MKMGFKAFLIYFLVPNLLSLVFYEFAEKNLLLSNMIFYLVVLIFFLFCSRKDIKRDFTDLKKNFKKYVFIILKWFLIGFGLMILSNLIIQHFIDILPNNEVSNREFIRNNPIIALLYLLVVAPLIEEYVFRFSFKNIKNYYLYTIFTSAFFAALHLFSAANLGEFWYFIPYFFLGFGFSNIYFKTKNYFASTIGHIIHNIICVIIILLF